MVMTEQQRAIERHAQTVLVLVLVAILLWVGSTTQKTAVQVASMAVQIDHLRERVNRPPAQFQRIEQRLDDIERQLQGISNEHLEFRRRMNEEDNGS